MNSKFYLVLLWLCCISSIYSQKPDRVKPHKGSKPNELFSFSGGIGALLQPNASNSGSFDLSSTTLDYFLPLKIDKDSIILEDQCGRITHQSTYLTYKGIHMQVLNRAAINLDSINANSNDYISSSKASPLTIRFSNQNHLIKKRFKEDQWLPSLGYKISFDMRAIPYTDKSGASKIGPSAHLFISLLGQFKAVEMQGNRIAELGTFYLQPSIGFVKGKQDLMAYIMNNDKSAFFAMELKLGFHSSQSKIKDWGFIVRYTWEDLTGPNTRIGLKVIPH